MLSVIITHAKRFSRYITQNSSKMGDNDENIEREFDFLFDKNELLEAENSDSNISDDNFDTATKEELAFHYAKIFVKATKIKDLFKWTGLGTDGLAATTVLCIIMIIFGIIWALIWHSLFGTSYGAPNIEHLRAKFPTQEETFWDVLETGINEVKVFRKPMTMVLLYKEEAENTLDNLLPIITKYAACNITNCDQNALILTDKQLNYESKLNYPNNLIEKYRKVLKEKGVMVVKNLENIPAIAARSFYNFCDKSSPIVRKALFIFTMKVAEFQSDNRKFMEEYLKLRWGGIRSDRFDALMNRICDIIVEIRA